MLISFKHDAVRDEAFDGLREWELRTGFRSGRAFARFLPRKNAERVSPVLLAGDPADPLEAVVTECGATKWVGALAESPLRWVGLPYRAGWVMIGLAGLNMAATTS